MSSILCCCFLQRLEDYPWIIWFEAAKLVAVPPPLDISAENVLMSALAGGLACAPSISVMHPIDTIKMCTSINSFIPRTCIKTSATWASGIIRGSITFKVSIIFPLSQLGALISVFTGSYGLRTGIFKASKLVLINVAPTLPDIQVPSLSSFCSTIPGTAVRIPCEVLKQWLQAGIVDNVVEAIVGTMHQDGISFFQGAGATVCWEVPVYVAGMGLYAEDKKLHRIFLNRDLEPGETVMVGALSGGLAAVIPAPTDVVKTRMRTAPQGRSASIQMVAFSILGKEGPIGLFKGAVPSFFRIAPLGAMNFAGYELAKKAMDMNWLCNRAILAKQLSCEYVAFLMCWPLQKFWFLLLACGLRRYPLILYVL